MSGMHSIGSCALAPSFAHLNLVYSLNQLRSGRPGASIDAQTLRQTSRHVQGSRTGFSAHIPSQAAVSRTACQTQRCGSCSSEAQGKCSHISSSSHRRGLRHAAPSAMPEVASGTGSSCMPEDDVIVQDALRQMPAMLLSVGAAIACANACPGGDPSCYSA